MSSSDFTKELVAMAQSHEELPKVRAELATAHSDNEALLAKVQRLELRLAERSNEITSLHSKVRETEAARDDAELRFLEADDRFSAFKRLFTSFQTDAVSLVKASEPVPEPEVPQAGEPAATSLAANAPHTTTYPSAVIPLAEDGGIPGPTEQRDDSSLGQRAEGELVAQTEVPSASTQFGSDTTSEHVLKSDDAPLHSGPYSGLRYYDHPSYVTLSAWLVGGGTEEDYHWRPAPPSRSPQFS